MTFTNFPSAPGSCGNSPRRQLPHTSALSRALEGAVFIPQCLAVKAPRLSSRQVVSHYQQTPLLRSPIRRGNGGQAGQRDQLLHSAWYKGVRGPRRSHLAQAPSPVGTIGAPPVVPESQTKYPSTIATTAMPASRAAIAVSAPSEAKTETRLVPANSSAAQTRPLRVVLRNERDETMLIPKGCRILAGGNTPGGKQTTARHPGRGAGIVVPLIANHYIKFLLDAARYLFRSILVIEGRPNLHGLATPVVIAQVLRGFQQPGPHGIQADRVAQRGGNARELKSQAPDCRLCLPHPDLHCLVPYSPNLYHHQAHRRPVAHQDHAEGGDGTP